MATMAKQESQGGILSDARSLIARMQQNESFRQYLGRRRERVALLVALCVALGVACASGVILFALGSRALLVLVAVLASPFVLIGSTALLLYVLFSWLENVALVNALHHGKPRLPAVPWGLATALVFVPFLFLLVREPVVGLALGLIAAGAPLAYLYLERRKR